MKFCIAWNNSLENGGQEVRICELNNDGFYVVEYPELGKREILRSLDFRFEILFEVGSYAFLDCYYREAVSSFAAALERFYEFYIEVAVRANKVQPEEYNQCWKHLKNQSERQLGAFIAAYTITRTTCPQLLSDDWRAFRNNVVHKGEIPDKMRTLEFGEEVGRLIIMDMRYLLDTHRKEVAAILSGQLETANKLIPTEDKLHVDRLSTVYVANVLSHKDSPAFTGWSLEDRLNLIRPIWLSASARFLRERSSTH